MSSTQIIPQLTQNAQTVLEKRYLLKDEQGRLIENSQQLFERVAEAVVENEGRAKNQWFDRFYEVMADRRFIPNSPTLMNAGKKKGQLSACFVLPVGDSIDSIFNTLKDSAVIHQSGGGTGFSFSEIRSQGSLVKSSQGVASGPVSFIRIFDVATETIKQGGTRRGANMAVLRVDHPDILEFIHSKRDMKSITNFNISVGVTDRFMQAVKLGGDFDLKDPRTKSVVRSVKARELFEEIVQSAWECGDPGLLFLDRIGFFNPTPNRGQLESTNPCGEQPLLAYESCNLGSLNLGVYFREGLKEGKVDWKLLRSDIWTAVRFLDNVIDVNSYPLKECRQITLRNRKIGLGVMGFADLLLLQGLSYNSPDAIALAEQMMSFVDREAKRASMALAKERGAFPNWKGSLWQKLGYPEMRNATVSTVAPTGTISMIAGASSGVEPLFAGVFARNVLSGERLMEIHPSVEKLLRSRGVLGVGGQIGNGDRREGGPENEHADAGKLSSDWEALTDEDIGKALGSVWTPSHRVPVEVHVRMQAAFQRHSDSAVSKTINLPEKATLADVAEAYLLAYRLGCKGITVYRDKSRSGQVLEHVLPFEKADDEDCPRCVN